jgi:two-component system response regulator AtoC
MSGGRVLVVDDEPKMQRVLEIMLRRMGHDVLLTSDGLEALRVAGEEAVDLVVTDLCMPGMDGVELLGGIRGMGLEVPVIIVTAYGTVESAVAAMKNGAYDYILRPFDVEAVEIAVTRALALGRVQRENRFLREEMDRGWGEFVGRGPAMQRVYDAITQVAPGKTSVLITGETGTGKELAARAIHRASARKDALFVPINCAAIPADMLETELFGHTRGAFTGAYKDRAGKFEVADGGTIFLDEITEMGPGLQAKLLRVLQENVIERLGGNRSLPVDIRVIAATNKDVRRAVREGRLREDLLYRINVFTIEMPPLRRRLEDIPLLVNHFLQKHSARLGRERPVMSEAALGELGRYTWPGNVRELENVIERAIVVSRGQGVIGIEHLPREIVAPAAERQSQERGAEAALHGLSLGAAVEQLEKRLIAEALAHAGGNRAKAARLLEISERSLWYKVKRYGLS